MKVYVVNLDFGVEGYGEPEFVTDTMDKALEFLDKKEDGEFKARYSFEDFGDNFYGYYCDKKHQYGWVITELELNT